MSGVLFAVTDQHDILELNVVRRLTHSEFTVLKTELADHSASRSCQVHHKAYFLEIFMYEEGVFDKESVFLSIRDARQFAERKLKLKLEAKEREVKSLQQKLAALQAQG